MAGGMADPLGNNDVTYGSIDNTMGGGALTRRKSVSGAVGRMASTMWRSARDGVDGGGSDALASPSSFRRRGSAMSDTALGAYAAAERKVDLQLHERQAGITEALAGYNSPMNILLVFAPLGIVAGFLHWSETFVFVCNFLGVIPLAMILGRATEDIAAHTNQTIGGLINATFGNAVELILSFSALQQGKLDVIRNTLVGSVLSNLLLVLGASFFFGGLVYREQEVLPQWRKPMGTCSILPCLALFSLPSFPWRWSAAARWTQRTAWRWRPAFSLFTSIILLTMYILYLVFQLYTHAELYAEVDEEAARPDGRDPEAGGSHNPDGVAAGAAAALPVATEPDSIGGEPVASLPVASAILVASVMVVSFCSEFVVGSIEGFSHAVGLGESFIALVLLPIIGNAVEHWAAVVTAIKDKMDLSIGIACGSSVQIGLFAAPVMVIASWFTGSARLTLDFHLFETVCLVLSVQVVTMTLRDSRTNWLEGAVLLCCYLIIAGAFFFMG
eukprot:TRINITY_DN354_c0_g1_i3.p1 TRINITY_DN354_c0_g1~~TRINITY_DN354_c0_g1_i3.p1  ORF type:complete len:501 (+),score=168.79 TRINITY_DN354_c0_g1_i3:231-1733(+)